MFLSRRIATMEVEFVSIERVMEYTRLSHEESNAFQSPLDDEDGALLPSKMAVVAKELYLKYEVPWQTQKERDVRHMNAVIMLRTEGWCFANFAIFCQIYLNCFDKNTSASSCRRMGC